ncbi:unnamed protein product [Urochloa decumbens]|uniref:Legume lectin domain-containing protein n=1 Tax=Urochloa decumbens TaxID=240449 RepID=A0ABC9AP54_9POAL
MASAASSSPQLLLFFLLIFTCFILLPLSLDAQETGNNTVSVDSPERLSFSFDFSNASSYNAGDVRFEGNASVHGGLIDLTCHSFGESVEGCIGRMSYNHPVPFHDGTTLASFDTSFTFVIKPNNLPAPGDGLAFFLSGYPSSLPPDTDGGSLGLINDDAAAYGSGQFVAVEFDTYQNVDWGDPSDNHIGIDVNTLRSVNTTDLNTTASGLLPSLKVHATMTATIQFDGTTGMLVASLLFHDHRSMEPAVVTYVLQDPKSLLPREVAVGFSAGSGTSTELHQILAWSFNSTLAASIPHKGWQKVNYARRKSIVLATVVVAPILTLFVCGITSLKFIKRRIRGKGSQDKGEVNVKEEDAALVLAEFTVYDFLQVLEATNNFSKENKLGQGGFGPVYKAWQLWKDGLWLQLVDTALGTDQGHALQLRRCINIALLCVQENAVDRPTMPEVVAMLCSESMALPEPKHPAYFHVRVGTEESSAVVETSSVDVTISVLHGR